MKHTVDTQVLQDILNYLTTKPFAEVNLLIDKLQKSAQPVAEESPAPAEAPAAPAKAE